MKISAEKLEELKANLAKRTIAALDERDGIQARDYQLAREVDAGLTVGQALAIVDDLVEAREQRRVLRKAIRTTEWIYPSAFLHTGPYCPRCGNYQTTGHKISCEIGNALAATEVAEIVPKTDCPRCGGRGYVDVVIPQSLTDYRPCPECNQGREAIAATEGGNG